jgi:hypothetical protein
VLRPYGRPVPLPEDRLQRQGEEAVNEVRESQDAVYFHLLFPAPLTLYLLIYFYNAGLRLCINCAANQTQADPQAESTVHF